ncbi:MAG: hypothetical protein M3032_13055 [Verrucomicrobiota bacterium]|nr:hypothetical protein [Verrucomicrobiota bacterium]
MRITLRIIYGVLLALLFWKAAAMRFELPAWPVAGRDAWGYVQPAFSKFSGGPFQHYYGRYFVYPAFLYLALAAGKTLGAITVAQHALGLATGALLIGCWECLRRYLRALPRTLHSLGGLALAAIYLLSSRPIQYEHDLRPEAITPFFAILNILLTLVFIAQHFRRAPSNRAAITGGAILINSVLLAMLKALFLLGAVFSAIIVIVALFDRRETWSRRFAVLGCALFAIAIFVIPESVLSRNDPDARAFLPTSLFSIHANIIAGQMEEDLARGQCGERGCEWLRGLLTSLREDMARSWQASKGYRSFGFDPDYLKYDRSSMDSWPVRFFDGDFDAMLDFCMHYYWRAVVHRPGAMLHKIVSQTGIFYRARNPSFTKRTRVRMDFLYRETVTNFEGAGVGRPEEKLVADYVNAARGLSQNAKPIRPPILVRIAVSILAFVYRPVLVAVLICLAVAAIRKRLRTTNGAFALVVLFLFSYNFGSALGTAVLHSLHVLRYNETQYAFSLLAVCAGLLFLLELSLQLTAKLVRRFASLRDATNRRLRVPERHAERSTR